MAGPVELFFHPLCLTWLEAPLTLEPLIQAVKDNIHEEGYVPIRWSWEGKRFEQAKKTWQSLLTTQTLLWLKTFSFVKLM